MATIHIERSHSLDRHQLRERLGHLAARLQADYGVDSRWEDERLVFQRSGVSGYLQLAEGRIELQITLGLLLRPLKGQIEASIRDYLAQELA